MKKSYIREILENYIEEIAAIKKLSHNPSLPKYIKLYKGKNNFNYIKKRLDAIDSGRKNNQALGKFFRLRSKDILDTVRNNTKKGSFSNLSNPSNLDDNLNI